MTLSPAGSAGPGAIASAFQWLEGTLLGTAATIVAVIAIASIGFLMMTGRIDVRRAAQVVIGCFVVFGASTIARGIMMTEAGDFRTHSEPKQAPVAPLQPSAAPAYDPYAGAAVPSR